MAKKVGILGGGIVGLMSAYYLRRSGCDVIVFDKGQINEGCSFGNAGMIVPSHFIPLAAPGMISKGIRWMFNSSSPFFVRPRLSIDLLKWGYHFYRHSTKEHVEQSAVPLKQLSLLSKSLYAKLASENEFDFGYHERGLLMLYKDQHTGEEEKETAEFANRIGIEAKVLNAQQVQDLEPDVRVDALGGVYFPGDAHLTPRSLVDGLRHYLSRSGVVFKTGFEITDFEVSAGKVKSLRSHSEMYDVDELVLAAGSWSGTLARLLSLNLPMQAGKGYSFTVPDVSKNIRVPSIFLEARVAVTPMGRDLRFGGTMEIAGVNHDINMNRVRGIVNSIPKYYPDMKVDMPLQQTVWHGLRPCSPDGMPYIGRLKKLSNVVLATGHSMMGISLAPATGLIVSELINDRASSIAIAAFDPERYK